MGSNHGSQEEKRLRILVVDDSATMRLSLVGVLSMQFDAISCASGKEALDHLAAGQFDLVLTDWEMPEMDGVSLVQNIREAHPQVQCLILSGNVAELQGRLKDSGIEAVSTLSKSTPPQTLIEQLLAVSPG